jgi:hypothetical protein
MSFLSGVLQIFLKSKPQNRKARGVLTKSERELKVFLPVAKDPFSKTPPETENMASRVFLSGMQFHFSFSLLFILTVLFTAFVSLRGVE